MESLITRRSALEFALAAAPCTAALLSASQAYAAEGSLTSTQAVDGSEALKTAASSSQSSSAVVYSGVRVVTRGKVKGSGWTGWRAESSVVGKQSGKGVVSICLKLKGLKGLKGSVSYRVYKRGKGWQDAVSDGKATPEVRNVEAVKISLKGDVAAHYDILYRVYMQGRGWGKWTKNGASAGATGKSSRVNALQVKLSAKTQEALGKSLGTVGVRSQAYVRTTGWQGWVAAGKTAGTTGKSKALAGFAVEVDSGKIGGSVKYCAHMSNIGWQDWKTGAAFAGKTSQKLEAVRMKLTGKVATKYDLYYRAHVANYGWLDWAKNGAVAGSTGFSLRMEAFQVKLVKKGADAPGDTRYPTVNKLEASKRLNGIDISSWQEGINIATIAADFVIVKATQGDWYTNPFFTTHAKATLSSGKLLGIYHFADLRGSATAQADFFIQAVKPYIRRCILVLDWEADALTLGPAWAKQFLDRVYKKTGVKPLIYMSQSKTHEYDWSSVAANYRLWVAQYLYRNMNTGYLSNPAGGTDIGYWKTRTIYQYSSSGRLNGYGSSLDLNKFYGSATVWRQLSTGA